jgi:host factor-I protein
MDTQNLQNVQDGFLNTLRRDRINVTIYLIGGVKLTGKIRSFDKFSVVLESGNLEQLIFKHAISTISVPRGSTHGHHQGGYAGERHQGGGYQPSGYQPQPGQQSGPQSGSASGQQPGGSSSTPPAAPSAPTQSGPTGGGGQSS